jgi:hypothetical protein
MHAAVAHHDLRLLVDQRLLAVERLDRLAG